ncbi:MAG TPA: hypothetical protein PLP19_04475 [bacterium]|nr:hypothetical protein [bacterium]HPN42726.1 hypothetical protein [bacterium]
MTFTIFPGETFLFPLLPGTPKPHLHIILTLPDKDKEFVVVSVSSKSSHPKPDLTVVLQKGCHRFIKHDSIILYAMTKIWTCENLQSAFACGNAQAEAPIDKGLLEIIKTGLFDSKFTSQKIINYCRSHINFKC